jgi:agmatinase
MKTLYVKKNFLGIGEKHSNYKNSKVVIISSPLEKTVSYGKGTAKGPKAILEASHYVEFYDEEFDRELCFEIGIATLEALKLQKLNHLKVLNKIYEAVKKVLNDDKFPIILGGEHSISSACVRAFLEKYNDLTILQFDAHSDLRDSYEGSKFSHASVMKRIYEMTKNIVQVGIRAQCKEESDLIKNENINCFYMRDIRIGKLGENWIGKIIDKCLDNVYITFDVDAFDPSLFPSTGTPEPGGLFWDETVSLIKELGRRKKIVGFDIVETAPKNKNDYSSFIAAKLCYKILNCAFQNKG